MFNDHIKALIEDFSKFPGIGKRNATRFVFYLSRLPKSSLERFMRHLSALQNVRVCSECFFPILHRQDDENSTKCIYCSDPQRNQFQIAVVEKEGDALAIEQTGRYKGVYHILGGTITTVSDLESGYVTAKELSLRVKRLLEQAKTVSKEAEIILALKPGTEGDASGLYLERMLRISPNIRFTRLGRGIPTGGDLEYADEETLSEALNNRK